MPAVATAIPVKPNTAAIIDTIKKRIIHPSIVNSLYLLSNALTNIGIVNNNVKIPEKIGYENSDNSSFRQVVPSGASSITTPNDPSSSLIWSALAQSLSRLA